MNSSTEPTVSISKSELDRLRAIEHAALRFERADSVVNQMSPAQWAAYIQLKALFHGGIKGEAETEDQAFRRRVVETVLDELKANGPLRRTIRNLY